MKISEGGETTLTCSISVSSLHWYRQRPGEKPSVLMFVFGSEEKTAGDHFAGRFDSQKKEGYLRLAGARLDHEANYLCAVDAL